MKITPKLGRPQQFLKKLLIIGMMSYAVRKKKSTVDEQLSSTTIIGFEIY
jgi:hypothetical protein